MIFKYREGDAWYISQSSRPERYTDHQVITLDDPLVTVDALVSLWEQHLEGENYHSMMHVPEMLVTTLRKCGVHNEMITAILWDIIESGGFI